jgi:hypothetical protein
MDFNPKMIGTTQFHNNITGIEITVAINTATIIISSDFPITFIIVQI